MEQTQNTFLKGLQQDTHPIQLGNDTLTDALNATFVTMNGNEIILLNDMGNALVQNAYLPQGYVPVGMKEYGGIIYIAAYNPITDKSQIGSFPSPQRRFGLGKSNDEEGILDITKFFDEDKLVKRNILVPLDSKNLLRAGDKFILYSDGSNGYAKLSTIGGQISNWNNVNKTANKVLSPKNNYFTLLAGILNSRNEFVDITKTLARFNTSSNKIIDFDSSQSDLYKFNSGYFIADDFNENAAEIALSQADSEIAKCRALDKLDLNTYAYKLVGPLYLKATFNAPTDFDYSIYGYKTESGVINLLLEYVLKYNCPDKTGNPTSGGSDENYVSYKDEYPVNTIDLLGCKFKYEIDESTEGYFDEDIFEKDNIHTSKYDPVNNLYTFTRNEIFNSGGIEEEIYDEIHYCGDYIEIPDYPNPNIKVYYDKSNCIDLPNSLIFKVGYERTIKIKKSDTMYSWETPVILYGDPARELNILGEPNEYFDTKTIGWENNYYVIKIKYKKLYTHCLFFGYLYNNNSHPNENITVKIFSSNLIQTNLLKYTLVPTIQYYDGSIKEIVDLQQSGVIDLSKLGSGEMELTSWRFYNDLENKNTSITYSFDAYPKRHHKFEDLKFDFWEVEDDIMEDSSDDSSDDTIYLKNAKYCGAFIPDNSIGYNGSRDDIIDWEEMEYPEDVTKFIEKGIRINTSGLQNNKLYLVVISWNDVEYDANDENVESKELHYEYRWLLTTELFNNNYFRYSNKFIKDFCNPEQSDDEQDYYDENVTIYPTLDYTVQGTVTSSEEEHGSKTVIDPTLDESSDDSDEIEWGYNTIYEAKYNFPVTIDWKQEYYPTCVEVSKPTVTCFWKNMSVTDDYVANLVGGYKKKNAEKYYWQITQDIPSYYTGNFWLTTDYIFVVEDRLFSAPVKVNAVYPEVKFDNLHDRFAENVLDTDTNRSAPKYLGLSLGFRNNGGGSGTRLLFHSIWINANENEEFKSGTGYPDDVKAINYSSDKKMNDNREAFYDLNYYFYWKKKGDHPFNDKNNAGLLYYGHEDHYAELFRISKKNEENITGKSSTYWNNIQEGFDEKYPLDSGIFSFSGVCTTDGRPLNSSEHYSEELKKIKPWKDRTWVRAYYGIGNYGWALTNENGIVNDLDWLYCAKKAYSSPVQPEGAFRIDLSKCLYNNYFTLDTNYNLYFYITEESKE